MGPWIVAAVASGVVFAAPPSWQRLMTSREYWAKVKWATFDRSDIFRGLSMQPRHLGFIIRSGEVQFQGADFEIELLDRSKEESHHPFAFSFGSKTTDAPGNSISGRLCRQLAADMEAGLGKPSVKIEFPFHPETKDHSGQIFEDVVNYRLEWEIGSSRIQLSCDAIDFKGGQSSGLVFIMAAEKSSLRPDKPLTWLRCTQSVRIPYPDRDPHVERIADMILVLDEYEHSVFYETLNPIDRKAIFTATDITFTRDTEAGSATGRLNRLTGQIQEERILKERNLKAEVTGSCESIEASQPKF
jgi:hypothetical protein